MLLGTLAESLFGNPITDKGTGKGVIRAGDGDIQASKGTKNAYEKILMPSHFSTNFGTQKYCQNEVRFDDVYSRDKLSDIFKDEVYLINLDEYSNSGINLLC